MRRYLLDTSLLAAYLYGRLHAVELITPWITRREAATSILVYGEVVEHLKSKPGYSRGHRSSMLFSQTRQSPGHSGRRGWAAGS
jgi:hypothetical protein